MADTTDIEKKSLEAHVELCAHRYKYLEEKLESMEEKLLSVVEATTIVKHAVEQMSAKNNDRLINWGIGIIGTLVAVIGYLVTHYILK